MDSFINALKSLGLVKLIITGIVLSTVLGAILYLINHIAEPDMALLYGDLEISEAGSIVSKLEGRNVPIQLKGGGTQIYVPIDMVAKLRMDLAEEGLPNGGSVGYEIFDKSEAFGSSIFVQNINRVRALEGELSRTIRTISQIKAARVHLVLPKREIFSKDKEDPSASIVLRLSTPGRLDNSRVQAIQHLVAAAVPGLSPKYVSIIDDRGHLLSAGDREQVGALSTKSEEYREAYETRLERAIDTLLGRTLGIGKVRTEVSAEMDFDRLTENSEIYDPEGQVVRSTQTVQEGSKAKEANTSGGLTIESELPEPESNGTDTPGMNANETNRSEETVNYEISKTVRTHIKETGAIKRLSVAVLIDGTHVVDADGKNVYQPRTPEEIDNISKLVKSAIGFDEKRGDTLEIINMPFSNEQSDDLAIADKLFFGLEKHHIIRIVETLILAIFGFLMVLLVMKPLLRPLSGLENSSNSNHLENDTQSLPQPTPTPTPAPAQISAQNAPEENIQKYSASPALAQQVDGELRASTVKQITQVIDKYPDESVNMIRNWMNG